jgi:hypothetical protein
MRQPGLTALATHVFAAFAIFGKKEFQQKETKITKDFSRPELLFASSACSSLPAVAGESFRSCLLEDNEAFHFRAKTVFVPLLNFCKNSKDAAEKLNRRKRRWRSGCNGNGL